jgi:myosin heavy subunit
MGQDNLIKLHFLDAPNILHNLSLRFQRDLIYT